MEAFTLHERFKNAIYPEIDDLDMALKMHDECCQTDEFKDIDFEDFIEIGRSLRIRQARLETNRTYHEF